MIFLHRKLHRHKNSSLLNKRNMIKELIPSVGHRARFISNLEDWRAIINSGMSNTSNVSNTVIILFLLFPVPTTTHFYKILGSKLITCYESSHCFYCFGTI